MTQYTNNYYDDYITGDKQIQIIIDLGCFYTKVRFSQETEPREIIKTPDIIDFKAYYSEVIRSSVKKIINKSNLNSTFSPSSQTSIDPYKFKVDITTKSFSNNIEEFINNILYNILQIHKKKKEKSYQCILLHDHNPEFNEFYLLVANMLLKTNIISLVNIVNSKLTPLYVSGQTSGLVISLGSFSSTIIPIFNSFINYNSFTELPLSVILFLERFICILVYENFYLKNINFKVEELSECLIKNNIMDLLTKSIICVNSKIKLQLQSEEERKKLEDTNKFDFSFNNQPITISLLGRIALGELFFSENFLKIELGGVSIHEKIIGVLSASSLETKNKICQNIVLSGGIANTIGFYKRIKEELSMSIKTEFTSLSCLSEKINIHKILYNRNLLSWVGGKFLFKLRLLVILRKQSFLKH